MKAPDHVRRAVAEQVVLNTSTPRYRVGDVVEYLLFGGPQRTARVTRKSANIKNGRPGFDAALVGGDDPAVHVLGPGAEVWGYDDQVVRVLGSP